MSMPTLGHLDPEFLNIMSRMNTMLRQVFRTENPLTGAVPGTGTAGMEAALCNVIEPGDNVLCCVFGYFSNRMRQMCERMGANITSLEREWGTVFTPDEVEEALKKIDNPKLVTFVHAETSTGVLQPAKEIVDIAHKYGAIVVMDAVTSLGGCPVLIDEWEVDVCFSGTQKCIGAPPGLAPITLSPRAMDIVRNRKIPVQSWYMDMTLVETYWADNNTGGRAYHYTAPSNALFGLYEVLRNVLKEGLENRWARHELHSGAFMAGAQALGFTPYAQEGHRLWQINAIRIPEGIDDLAVRSRLLSEYNIEIGAGLGPVKGQAWRVGIMGCSATEANVLTLLTALETILKDMGYAGAKGEAPEAAKAFYQQRGVTSVPPAVGESVASESVAKGVAHEN